MTTFDLPKAYDFRNTEQRVLPVVGEERVFQTQQ